MKAAAKWILNCFPVPVVYHTHRLFHLLKGDTRGQADRTYLANWPRPLRVVSGPFKGLLFPGEAYASPIVPCALGIYEKELHNAVETLCSLNADVIVDIGAGEGYYSVGMALRNPQARSIAFELFKPTRHILNRTAILNRVTNCFTSHGTCTISALGSSLQNARRPIVICDCEGAEDQLLTPAEIPDLTRTTILVELHDHMLAGVSRRLRDRFCTTHTIEEFRTVDRTPADIPSGIKMTPQEAATLLSEQRGDAQSWFLLRPKD